LLTLAEAERRRQIIETLNRIARREAGEHPSECIRPSASKISRQDALQSIFRVRSISEPRPID
jgi:hypothetical protein